MLRKIARFFGIKVRKTKTEIILETANFYNLHNRGIDSESTNCVYKDPVSGNMCAFGRCIKDGSAVFNEYNTGGIRNINERLGIDNELKEEYRGHEEEFWVLLQTFHDICANWDENGLTEKGIESREYLLERFKNK